MDNVKYKVIYRTGDRKPVEIASFYKKRNGEFVFEYVHDPKFEFPGFDSKKKKFVSNHIWNQIAFRIPNSVRNQHPRQPLEKLLHFTKGRLVTDNFEFRAWV